MARIDFRLTEREFWTLTPRQFEALAQRKNKEYELIAKQEERADHRAALICSVIANVNRPKNKKRVKPEDFLGKKHKGQPQKRKTWQEQLAFVEQLNAAFGGRDLRKKGG
jgi:hypothetical protein